MNAESGFASPMMAAQASLKGDKVFECEEVLVVTQCLDVRKEKVIIRSRELLDIHPADKRHQKGLVSYLCTTRALGECVVFEFVVWVEPKLEKIGDVIARHATVLAEGAMGVDDSRKFVGVDPVSWLESNRSRTCRSWKEEFMPHHLLLVDEDVTYLQATRKVLVSMGYRVEVASALEEARNRLAQRPVDGLLVDIEVAGSPGLDLLHEALEQGRTRTALVISEAGSIPKAVEIMRLGASDFLPKPVTEEELRASLTRALGKPTDGHLDEDERRAWRDTYCPNFYW